MFIKPGIATTRRGDGWLHDSLPKRKKKNPVNSSNQGVRFGLHKRGLFFCPEALRSFFFSSPFSFQLLIYFSQSLSWLKSLKSDTHMQLCWLPLQAPWNYDIDYYQKSWVVLCLTRSLRSLMLWFLKTLLLTFALKRLRSKSSIKAWRKELRMGTPPSKGNPQQMAPVCIYISFLMLRKCLY